MGRQLLAANSPNYFDLEDPASLARLDEPMTALRELKDLIVIDEVQRRPELFPVLRVLVDRGPLPAANSTQTLRTSMETVDTSGSGRQKNGRRFRKTLKRRRGESRS